MAGACCEGFLLRGPSSAAGGDEDGGEGCEYGVRAWRSGKVREGGPLPSRLLAGAALSPLPPGAVLCSCGATAPRSRSGEN